MAGSLTQERRYDDSSLWAYTYGGNGKMATAADGTDNYDFDYDGDRNRARQTVNSVVTEYLVDRTGGLPEVVAEINSGGNLKVFYVRGLELISQERNGTVRYYGHDGLGSTILLTDLSGLPTDHYRYDAWGNVVATDGPTPNTFRYTGQQQDGTKLYYLRARYYGPHSPRFLTRDPVRGAEADPPQLHVYAYAINSPVAYCDPSGAQVTLGNLLAGIAIAAILGAAFGFLAEYARGGTNYGEAALLGAIAGQIGLLFWFLAPEIAVIMGVLGFFTTAEQFWRLMRDPQVDVGRKVAAGALLAASIVGTGLAARAVYLKTPVPVYRVADSELRASPTVGPSRAPTTWVTDEATLQLIFATARSRGITVAEAASEVLQLPQPIPPGNTMIVSIQVPRGSLQVPPKGPYIRATGAWQRFAPNVEFHLGKGGYGKDIVNILVLDVDVPVTGVGP